METPVLFFYGIGNYVGIPYSIKKPCRAGSRSGGKVDVAYSDPPQAENPAKQDSFLLYGKKLNSNEYITKCYRNLKFIAN